MHLGVNISNALQQLESVKAAVDQSDDPKLKVKSNYVSCNFHHWSNEARSKYMYLFIILFVAICKYI